MDFETVKNILLEELRHRGYSPNPSDVTVAVQRIIALSSKELEVASGESVEEAKKLAAAGTPLITIPPKV